MPRQLLRARHCCVFTSTGTHCLCSQVSAEERVQPAAWENTVPPSTADGGMFTTRASTQSFSGGKSRHAH